VTALAVPTQQGTTQVWMRNTRPAFLGASLPSDNA
jgi:hypothetical protein